MNVCVLKSVPGGLELGLIYMTEASLYFSQVFPPFYSTFSHGLDFKWLQIEIRPDVELQSQLRHSQIPFYTLDIQLVLPVLLYKSEDRVYTHALTG